jgi:hypothetical protein
MTLTIKLETHLASLGATNWTVSATAHTNYVCRVHEGLEATIETPDGVVVGAIVNNPAEPNQYFQDLFRPGTPTVAAHVTWSQPCADRPLQLVVRAPYAKATTIAIPKEKCVWGPIEESRLGIDGAVQQP